MKNLLSFILFLLFIFNRCDIIHSGLLALTIWSKNIFPILFPTFILIDLLISNEYIINISLKIGYIFSKIFKTSNYSFFVFLISSIAGTPTNAKILYSLYNNKIINNNDINKILSFTYLFNPFFLISFVNIKIIIILIISNLITGIILRNYYIGNSSNKLYNITFDLNESIKNNIVIILNILGTLTVFIILINLIPNFNPYINSLIACIFEFSSALYKINISINSDYFYLIALSFGGLSILIQIKSILKDTFLDLKFILKSRIITLIVSLIICYITRFFVA